MKQRKSNFELLRIVAMVMIVLAHAAGQGQFSRHAVGINRYIALFFTYGGKFWSSVLVILGASFACSRGVKFKSIFHIVFSAAMVTFGCTLLKPELHASTGAYLKACALSLFPISTHRYWFVTTYVFLLLLAPWLNYAVQMMNRREYTVLLAIATLLFSVPYTFLLGSRHTVHNDLLWFLYLYFIGGYLVRFPPSFTRRCGLMFFLGCADLALIFWICTEQGTNYYSEQGSILMAIGAALFFCAFRSLSLKPSRWINRIASGAFMVYLIHQANMLRHFWWFSFFRCDAWWTSAWFVPNVLAIAVFFFILGMILDAACRWLERLLYRIPPVRRLFDWLDGLLQSNVAYPS